MTDLHADNGFLEYYQFEHDPFLGRGSSFKFFAAKRRPVLVELHHLARYSKLMLVVTGPEGSGKTVLRQALVASSKEPVTNIVIAPSATTDAAAMLQHVSAALGLHGADIAGVLRHIEQMLITGQEVHVIVDNAECLDESALLFLQRIAQGVNDACARVFVFSDSTICPLLKKVADNADLHHVIALEPFDQQEVCEYLEQRLVAAGQPLDIFTDDQIRAIYAQSQGWPGQVNRVAKNLLMAQMRQSSAVNKSPSIIPFKHIAILVVLSIALMFAWFMQTTDSESKSDSLANIDAVNIDPALQPVEVVADSGKTVTLDLPLLDQPMEPVTRAPLAQALSGEDDEHFLPAEEPVPAVEAVIEPPQVVSAPTPISAPVPISAPAPKKTTVAPPNEVITASKVAAVPLAQKSSTAAKAQPVVKPAAAAKVVPSAAGLSGSAGDSQWYKQQARTRYTLQVLGTRTESVAQAFVKQNRSQYHYFRKLHQGQALFVVTFGSFADRASAQAAIASLPEKIRNDKPWPRTFLSIQQELR